MTAQETFNTAVDELLTRGERPAYIEEIIHDEDRYLVNRIALAYGDAIHAENWRTEDYGPILRKRLRMVAVDWGLTLPAGGEW